ncbi:MAG: hypothetical protein KDA63_06680 [Planctomycetales bacterium]|nr:hypothetical protein [Planctomycetales bacterium]
MDHLAHLAGRLPGDFLRGALLGKYVRPSVSRWIIAGLVGYTTGIHLLVIWWRGIDDPLVANIGVGGLLVYHAIPMATIFSVVFFGIWIGRRERAEAASAR